MLVRHTKLQQHMCTVLFRIRDILINNLQPTTYNEVLEYFAYTKYMCMSLKTNLKLENCFNFHYSFFSPQSLPVYLGQSLEGNQDVAKCLFDQ